MPVRVPPHTHDRNPRSQLGEAAIARGASAPVVTDLEDVDRADPSRQPLLRAEAGVSGKEPGEVPIRDPEDRRALVDVEPPPAPRRVRMQNLETDAVEL